MATRQYIGARYVPLFADPAEWDNTRTYEPLTIVMHQGNSFTSRQAVPIGIDIDNSEYWAETGNWNSQVEAYRREVMTFDDRIEDNADAIAAEATARQTADEGLEDAIEDEAAARAAADDAIDVEIADEAAARAAADDLLDNKIDQGLEAEEDAREAADTTLQGNITAEATARIAADADLQTSITNILGTLTNLKFTSVKDHGAVGDGVADDTQAFYDAIGTQYAPAPYNVVIIPEGTYRLTEWIYLHSNLIILGPGHVVNDCQTGGIFNWTCTNSDNKTLKNVIIDGVEFSSASYQNGGSSYRRDNAAIQIYHAATNTQRTNNITIQNCYIHDVGWAGISCYSGLGTGGGTNHPTVEIAIINNKVKNVGKNSLQGTMGVGIHILGSSARVIGNHVYNCNAECLTFDDGCSKCIALGNTFITSGGAGIVSCDEGTNLQFIGNNIQATSAIPCIRLNCGSGDVTNVNVVANMLDGGRNGVSMGDDNTGFKADVVTVSGNVMVGQSGNPIWAANNSHYSQGGNWANWNASDAAYAVNSGIVKHDAILDAMYATS